MVRAISDARPNRIGWRRACPATLPRRQPALAGAPEPTRAGVAAGLATASVASDAPPAGGVAFCGRICTKTSPSRIMPSSPRAFLDSAGAPIQVAHFGFQRRIARAQAFVGLFLRRHLALQIPDLEPATLTHPQRVLDQA